MVGIVTPSERTVSAPPNVVDGGLAAPVGFQVMNPLGTAAWSKYGPGNRDWQVAPTGPIINSNSITAYCVSTASATTPGSDSNTGDCTHPLLTLSELAGRLFYARIETPITITVTGAAAVTDVAHWTFTANDSLAFGVTGTFPVTIIGAPVALYSGTATTVTTITAGATTTDNEIADTAIPTSYTASGMLAGGVLFQRTNSTPLVWFAAKDLTSKTLRISQPMLVSTLTDTALTTSDAYTASTLPTLNQMTFSSMTPYTVTVQDFSMPGFYQTNDPGIYYVNDWFPTGATLSAGSSYINCAVAGGSTLYGSQGPQSTGVWADGLIKGTGNTHFNINFSTGFFMENRITMQGANIQVQFGTLFVQNDLAVNDDTSTSGVLVAQNNSQIQSLGTIQGATNSELLNAKTNSTITFTSATPMVAGSSSDTTTGIKSPPTASTNVAGYTSGNTVLNTSGNGIYKTQ